MKKLLVFLVLCLGLVGSGFAQMSFSRPFDKTLSLGIKGGINVPRMFYYNNQSLMLLPQSFAIKPQGGLFLDVPITAYFGFAPEVVFVQRGTDTRYVHHPSSLKVHYSISTNYVDFRFPLELKWSANPSSQPYVIVGVEAGMCLSGKIHLDRRHSGPLFHGPMGPPMDIDAEAMDETIDVSSSSMSLIQAGDSIITLLRDPSLSQSETKELVAGVFRAMFNGSNMSLVHAGAYAGLGVRSKFTIVNQEVLLKFDVTCHQGFLDTYSAYEKTGASQSLNVNAYQIKGYRLPQGLEISLGIALPLKPRLRDACSTFANDRYRSRGRRGVLFGY